VGDRCFGLVRDGSVLCFTWCSLSAIEYGPVRRRLEKNEAYFYGAWTPYASRGLSLAPYLRYQCYRKLDSEGITVLYSLSDYFNRPAVRFKRKMGARELQTGLNVVIWGGLRKHWILKRPQAAR
jgi:hypothetical protein